MFADRGIKLPPHLVPVVMAVMDARIPKLLIIIGPGSGKLQPYSLLIPTPHGERRWGDLKPGDHIFGSDGAPTKIIQRHEQGCVPIYRVNFDDGSSTLVGLEHLWRIRGRKQRKHGKNNWITLTTAEILHEGLTVYEASSPNKGRKNFEIPIQGKAQFKHIPVPFDPYAIGVWLGDGSAGTGSYTKDDADLWRINGLKNILSHLGILRCRSWEKYIPNIYKENSIDVRLSVLRGLMDTDGTCDAIKGSPIYTSTSKILADDVCWLVRSLGGKASITPKQKHFTYKGERKPGRVSYDVNICMPDDTPPFSLTRKRKNVRATSQTRYLTRWITRIEYSHDELAMCVTVDADDHLYLCNDFIVTHNSLLLSVTYPAFMIGQDPTLTILALSAGEALMQGFMSSVMEWIEHSAMWKLLFPNVKPDKGKGWSTEKGLFVTGRKPGDPDASYFAVGLSSKALTGKHAKIIIGDDLHDAENSASAEACMKVRDLYYRQIIGRADPQGARFIFAGRRWHQEDIYGHLKATGDWVVMELQAQRDNAPDLYWDVTIPEGVICCLNEAAFMTGEEKAAKLKEIEEQTAAAGATPSTAPTQA
jgi:hypothetical protein